MPTRAAEYGHPGGEELRQCVRPDLGVSGRLHICRGDAVTATAAGGDRPTNAGVDLWCS